MRFPRFWKSARTGHVTTWGWSDESAADALRLAGERQERVLATLRGEDFAERDPYSYGERPLREEVIREFTNAAGEPTAIVSRNSMGCRVLNTSELMFVDVDEPRRGRRGGGGFWSALFGGKKAAPPESPLAERAEAQARQWVASNHAWRWRIYRTAAGVRLMAVHAGIKPDDPVVQAMFEAFGADPLYRQLCKDQECFRARLTPKPFRCDLERPPVSWPFRDSEAEAAMRRWESEYLAQASSFATCRFLAEAGSAPAAPEFAELIQIHDDATQAHHDLPLA